MEKDIYGIEQVQVDKSKAKTSFHYLTMKFDKRDEVDMVNYNIIKTVCASRGVKRRFSELAHREHDFGREIEALIKNKVMPPKK